MTEIREKNAENCKITKWCRKLCENGPKNHEKMYENWPKNGEKISRLNIENKVKIDQKSSKIKSVTNTDNLLKNHEKMLKICGKLA